MGHPDGAHTHGSGGGGFDPMPILIIIGAIAVAGPVAAAAMELLHILLIAVVVILSLGAVGLAAVIAFRVHCWRAGGTTRVSLPAPTVVRAPVEDAVEPFGVGVDDTLLRVSWCPTSHGGHQHRRRGRGSRRRGARAPDRDRPAGPRRCVCPRRTHADRRRPAGPPAATGYVPACPAACGAGSTPAHRIG
jgi:hypothetical protein